MEGEYNMVLRKFVGYNFGEALYRSKTEIKAVLALLVGLNVYVGFDWKSFFVSVAAGVIALVGKLAMDAVDYYFTEIPEVAVKK